MRRLPHRDDDNDEDIDDPLEADQDGPAMVDVEDCPYCRQPISSMAEQCPRCKNYIFRDEVFPSKQTRRWVWATMVMVALLVLAVLLKR